MGIIALIVAAFMGFATGPVWYGVLGSRWMSAVGMTKKQVETDKDRTPCVVRILRNELKTMSGELRDVTSGVVPHT